MKNIKYIIPCVLGMALLASCQEEEKITINPAAEDGTLTFVLNEPAYDDYVYVLRSADADSVMETLTVRPPPQPTMHKYLSVSNSPKVHTKSSAHQVPHRK